MVMSLRSLLLWLVGSVFMWGVWLAFLPNAVESAGEFWAGFFTIIFAIGDVIALVGTITAKGQ